MDWFLGTPNYRIIQNNSYITVAVKLCLNLQMTPQASVLGKVEKYGLRPSAKGQKTAKSTRVAKAAGSQAT